MTQSYRNFLKLLEQWPVDSTKVGRYVNFYWKCLPILPKVYNSYVEYKKVKAHCESWLSCRVFLPSFIASGASVVHVPSCQKVVDELALFCV
jgi:hypothetical protein